MHPATHMQTDKGIRAQSIDMSYFFKIVSKERKKKISCVSHLIILKIMRKNNREILLILGEQCFFTFFPISQM